MTILQTPTFKDVSKLSKTAGSFKSAHALASQPFKGTTCVLSRGKTLFFFFFPFFLGKPVMIVIEYMENGALDAFLRVSERQRGTYIALQE